MDVLERAPERAWRAAGDRQHARQRRPVNSPERDRGVARSDERPAAERNHQQQGVEQIVDRLRQDPLPSGYPLRHPGRGLRDPHRDPDQHQDKQAEPDLDVQGLYAILRGGMVRQDFVHVPAKPELDQDQGGDDPVQGGRRSAVAPRGRGRFYRKRRRLGGGGGGHCPVRSRSSDPG